MATPPKLTKGHFEWFACEIRSSGADEPARLAQAALIAKAARLTNAAFDETRFYKACGLLEQARSSGRIL